MRRLAVILTLLLALSTCSTPAYAARIEHDGRRAPLDVAVSTHPVERWAPLVARWFQPEDVDLALRIIDCESGGNPKAKNPHSTASGLFQHLRMWWGGVFDPFDPEQSVEHGARLFYDGGVAHWNASRACWSRTDGLYSRVVVGVEYDPIAGPDGVEVTSTPVTVP